MHFKKLLYILSTFFTLVHPTSGFTPTSSSTLRAATVIPVKKNGVCEDMPSSEPTNTDAPVYDILLTNLQRVDSTISSFKILKHIEQGSAEGFVIDALTTENDTRHLFVKWVDPKKYSHKVWADLRRTIHYTRTEVRFYNEIMPLLQQNVNVDADDENWSIFPEIYLAEYNLEGLMEEDESTEASDRNLDPKYDDKETSVLEGRYGIIVMDNLNEIECFQRAPLRQPMAVAAVRAIAKFHATSFENEAILSKISQRLCRYGGSYHLKNRNPKEMQHLVSAWEGFVRDIGPAAPPGFFDDEERINLGKRLYDAAEYISQVLSPTPSSPYATIVHGDYKAMNVFFQGSEENPAATPILIDFASTGVGLGVSDLAMHVAHVALPEDLKNGMEDILLKEYYNALQGALQGLGSDQGSGDTADVSSSRYSEEDLIRHYQFATIDYFRFILGRQWRNATMKVFEKRNQDTNFAMVNRNVDAALNFVERTDKYLRNIEKEMENCAKKNDM